MAFDHTKTLLQDSAMISLRNIRRFLQISAVPRVQNSRFFRWKMPLAVCHSGSEVSEESTLKVVLDTPPNLLKGETSSPVINVV